MAKMPDRNAANTVGASVNDVSRSHFRDAALTSGPGREEDVEETHILVPGGTQSENRIYTMDQSNLQCINLLSSPCIDTTMRCLIGISGMSSDKTVSRTLSKSSVCESDSTATDSKAAT